MMRGHSLPRGCVAGDGIRQDNVEIGKRIRRVWHQRVQELVQRLRALRIAPIARQSQRQRN
jgi:hypothetical protein